MRRANHKIRKMVKLSPHATGIALVSISAVVWSTVGLFAKGIEADVWVILFWRGLFSIAVLGLYVRSKSKHGIILEVKSLGWPGWISALVGAAATICFISAFKYTSIANVSIIYAIVPFIVAVLAWVFMREKTTLKTIIGAVIALVGVAIMVGGSRGSSSLTGDILAICMAIGMATLVVIFRMFPGRPMVLSTIISAAIHVVLSFILSSPFNVSIVDLILLVCFGAVFATATILMIEGTRLIPASKSALISTAEAPLGPIWAWLVFAQIPLIETWVGGGLVLMTVLWNVMSEKRI
jgi:drug/metabolite transporter (DMT)-like permease